MLLTQIIAGDALEEVNTKLRLLAKLKRSAGAGGTAVENGWKNPDKKTNGVNRPNGIKDETDVKEETEVHIFFCSGRKFFLLRFILSFSPI